MNLWPSNLPPFSNSNPIPHFSISMQMLFFPHHHPANAIFSGTRQKNEVSESDPFSASWLWFKPLKESTSSPLLKHKVSSLQSKSVFVQSKLLSSAIRKQQSINVAASYQNTYLKLINKKTMVGMRFVRVINKGEIRKFE